MSKIIHNYLYNILYQIITLILPFILIPYLSRVLGAENLGVESYLNSMTGYFITFGNIGVLVYGIRQVAKYRDDKTKLKKEVYNILLVRFIFSTISLILYIMFSLNTGYQTLFLINLSLFIASTFFDVSFYFTGKEKFKLLVMRNIYVKITGVILILLFVKSSGDLWIYLLINGLTMLIPNLWFLWLMFKELGFASKIDFSIRDIKLHIRCLFPFFTVSFISQVYLNIDRIIFERFDLISELGVYSQFLKINNMVLAPITAVGAILMPLITNLAHAQKKEKIDEVLFKSTNFILLLAILLFFGVQAVSVEFLSLFLGENYLQYINVFRLTVILVITGSLSNIIIQQIVIPNNKEKDYAFSIFIAALMKIVVVLILINALNIYAGILAYLISEIFIMIWCSYKIRKLVSLSRLFDLFNLFKIILAGIIVYSFLINIDFNVFLKSGIGLVIYLVSLFILKEKMLFQFIALLKVRFLKDPYR